MELLRSHAGDNDPRWSPDKGITGADVLHACGVGTDTPTVKRRGQWYLY
jgi:hypothetical protein